MAFPIFTKAEEKLVHAHTYFPNFFLLMLIDINKLQLNNKAPSSNQDKTTKSMCSHIVAWYIHIGFKLNKKNALHAFTYQTKLE